MRCNHLHSCQSCVTHTGCHWNSKLEMPMCTLITNFTTPPYDLKVGYFYLSLCNSNFMFKNFIHSSRQMCVKVFVTIIQSVLIVQKMNVFGVRIMNVVLTKMHIHLHFHMVNAENGRQMNIVVELHLVSAVSIRIFLL